MYIMYTHKNVNELYLIRSLEGLFSEYSNNINVKSDTHLLTSSYLFELDRAEYIIIIITIVIVININTYIHGTSSNQ